MSPIMMNQQIEEAFKTMLDQHTTTMVSALATKYGFDEAEAMKVLKGEEISKTKKGKGAKPKAAVEVTKADVIKTKRAPNAYMLWAKENRESTKTTNPEMTGREVTKELGRIWREDLSDETRSEWKAKATGSQSGSASDEGEEVEE